eukprot:m.677136 g.677136  ORF g.677136 m.677136 type:complete len:180 (+) comp58569_c0_seq1:149-688(+)
MNLLGKFIAQPGINLEAVGAASFPSLLAFDRLVVLARIERMEVRLAGLDAQMALSMRIQGLTSFVPNRAQRAAAGPAARAAVRAQQVPRRAFRQEAVQQFSLVLWAALLNARRLNNLLSLSRLIMVQKLRGPRPREAYQPALSCKRIHQFLICTHFESLSKQLFKRLFGRKSSCSEEAV